MFAGQAADFACDGGECGDGRFGRGAIAAAWSRAGREQRLDGAIELFAQFWFRHWLHPIESSSATHATLCQLLFCRKLLRLPRAESVCRGTAVVLRHLRFVPGLARFHECFSLRRSASARPSAARWEVAAPGGIAARGFRFPQGWARRWQDRSRARRFVRGSRAASDPRWRSRRCASATRRRERHAIQSAADSRGRDETPRKSRLLLLRGSPGVARRRRTPARSEFRRARRTGWGPAAPLRSAAARWLLVRPSTRAPEFLLP